MQRKTKTRAKANLQAALDEIDNLKGLRYGSQEAKNWRRYTEKAIEHAFDDKWKVSRFREAVKSLWISYPGSKERSEENRQNEYISELTNAETYLKSMLDEIDHFWEDDVDQQAIIPTKAPPIDPNDKEIFVVHGRNQKVLNSVKAFLQKLGLKPIILSEQPGKGRTIIEKFEDHAQVKYAVALLTPDDKALLNESTGKQELRPRQNVIFEMGFFVGTLGRQRVAALRLGEIEIPSDYVGVEYIKLDDSGWKGKLYQELHAAGFEIEAEQSILDDCEGFIIDEMIQGDAVTYEEPRKSVDEWDGNVHRVSEAYYCPEGQVDFAVTSILDKKIRTNSYIKSLPQEGNPRDMRGNEFPGVQYYQVVLDGIDPKVGADLKKRYQNDEMVRWRLVNEDKSVWETQIAVRSKTIIGAGAKLIISFRITEMDFIIRNAV